MAKRNTLKLDISGLEEMIVKLDALNGDVKKAVTDALMQAAETVHDDTVDALQDKYLPSHGEFSTGRTRLTVAEPVVEWQGTTAIAPVGFDYGEKGAGGFLISGTPRMQPDARLEEIYTRKRYMKALQNDMQEVIGDYIAEKMEG